MSQLLSILPQTPPQMEKELLRRRENGVALDQASPRPTFALYTLGCKVNQYDSHQIARMLVAEGFRRVDFKAQADLYVIDSCTVTAEADKKSRKAASRARRNNPDGLVAVTGCAATRDREQFLRVAPGALVLANSQKMELPGLAILRLQQSPGWAQSYEALRASTGSEPVPSATRERAVLKIQDGCNHKCSYCIIPSVRGSSTLKSTSQLMTEARAFVLEGAREIVVTGVSMGDWNQSEVPRSSLGRNAEMCTLIRAVATIEGLERVRVSSLDPADVDEEWLRVMAHTPTVCPQIHLALQSGSASVLRRMRRRYTPEMYLKWAHLWRQIRPDAALTTDVIVGFPGETEAEWQETMQLCREARFSAIHVFPYSPREGTFAAQNLDALGGLVPSEVQDRRVGELLELASSAAREFAGQFLGKEQAVLVEGSGTEYVEGLTMHYVKAKIRPEGKPPAVGDIVRFIPTRWQDGALQN